MVASPRCVECDAPITNASVHPCWRCQRAWRWLITEQDSGLIHGWALVENVLSAHYDMQRWLVEGLRIAAWQNRVLTLAGWERHRRWYARRYIEATKTVLATDKDIVLVTPRVGATIARKIQREESQ